MQTIIAFINKPTIPVIATRLLIHNVNAVLIAKTIIYIINFLKYLLTGVLNSYLCIKYGSIHEYDANCAILVAKNIPATPNNLHNTIEKNMFVIAPIYGVAFPFWNNPNVVLYVYPGFLNPSKKKLNANEIDTSNPNIYLSPSQTPTNGFSKTMNAIVQNEYTK